MLERSQKCPHFAVARFVDVCWALASVPSQCDLKAGWVVRRDGRPRIFRASQAKSRFWTRKQSTRFAQWAQRWPSHPPSGRTWPQVFGETAQRKAVGDAFGIPCHAMPRSRGGCRAAEGARPAFRPPLQLCVLPCGQFAYRESAQLSVPSQVIVGTLSAI